jgi:hypothetical protein
MLVSRRFELRHRIAGVLCLPQLAERDVIVRQDFEPRLVKRPYSSPMIKAALSPRNAPAIDSPRSPRPRRETEH